MNVETAKQEPIEKMESIGFEGEQDLQLRMGNQDLPLLFEKRCITSKVMIPRADSGGLLSNFSESEVMMGSKRQSQVSFSQPNTNRYYALDPNDIAVDVPSSPEKTPLELCDD